jgi:hypothetical protein
MQTLKPTTYSLRDFPTAEIESANRRQDRTVPHPSGERPSGVFGFFRSGDISNQTFIYVCGYGGGHHFAYRCHSARCLTPYRRRSLTPASTCEALGPSTKNASRVGSTLEADGGQSSALIHSLRPANANGCRGSSSLTLGRLTARIGSTAARQRSLGS